MGRIWGMYSYCSRSIHPELDSEENLFPSLYPLKAGGAAKRQTNWSCVVTHTLWDRDVKGFHLNYSR